MKRERSKVEMPARSAEEHQRLGAREAHVPIGRLDGDRSARSSHDA